MMRLRRDLSLPRVGSGTGIGVNAQRPVPRAFGEVNLAGAAPRDGLALIAVP
jgi:hypothetical protein